MGINCTRCEGLGYLNVEQFPEGLLDKDQSEIDAWLEAQPEGSHDITGCDCCSDGDVRGEGEHGFDEKTFDCM